MSHPLVTAEDLATYLNQPVNTAQAQLVLDLAADAVRQAAGQKIDFARSTTELPVRSGFVMFPQRPVVVDADNPILVEGYAPGSWRIIPERNGLYLFELPAINRSERYNAPTVVSVTYSHGFREGEVPDTLRQIILAAAARHIGNPEGFAQYTVGGMQVTWQNQTGGTAFGLLLEKERQVVRRFFGGSAAMLTIA